MTEQTLFEQALDLPDPADRAAFLDRACGRDPALRDRLDRLLARHREAGRFLERPPAAVADAAETAGYAPEAGGTAPGERVGPYALLEPIGEGGMGAVYLAEQTHPVRRKVAVKLIKPGMDSRQVVARFEAERQALALMDHPHIARVLDGGATPDGRPYFVMELVRGAPVTDYCDRARLPLPDRLRLFADVCRAVQHAHQKGVIHRDLKPSNVLVTVIDGRPVPKVIDFGIAKATGAALTDRPAHTGFHQLVGTPLYMSPEQAELAGVDVDTRSDVYSLGVLLYELLTGTTPFDPEALRAAGFDGMRRIIREDDPPRPSHRLSTLAADSSSTVAEQRGVDARRLGRLMRSELDWVVMKCLEKDRNRRYESAGALAAEVERYLADRPVEARSPSAVYRVWKFARRNRAALVIVAVSVAAVLAVAGTLGWTVRESAAKRWAAEHAASAALADADRFEQRARWPDALAAVDRALAVLEGATGDEGLFAVARARRRGLAMVMRVDEIRLEMAAVPNRTFDAAAGERLYAEAFREYGVDPDALDPSEVARRLPDGSTRPHLVSALDHWAHLRRTARASGWERLLAAAQAADDNSWRNEFRGVYSRRDRASAIALATAAPLDGLHPISVQLLEPPLPDADAVRLLGRAQRQWPGDFWLNHQLAVRLIQQSPPQPEAAVGFFRAAVAVRPDSPLALTNLGIALDRLGRWDEGGDAHRAAIRAKPDFALAHSNLGASLVKSGRPPDEAIPLFREAIRLDPAYAVAHYNLGRSLYDERKWSEAEAAFRTAAQLRPGDAATFVNLGSTQQRLGKIDEAEAAFRRAIALDPTMPGAHNGLGALLCDHRRDYDGAVAAFRRALTLQPDHPLMHANLGNALAGKGDWSGALAAYREAVRREPTNAELRNGLATQLFASGAVAEAAAEYREAIRLRPDDARFHYHLGNALAVQSPDAAAAAYREAIRFSPDMSPAHNNLGNLLVRLGRVDQGLDALREARRLRPGDHSIHVNLSQAFFLKQDWAAAAASAAEAVRLKPDLPEAHCNLGHALKAQGRFRAALASLRRGHQLGVRTPGWRYPSAGWVRECEYLVALDNLWRQLHRAVARLVGIPPVQHPADTQEP